MRAVVGDLFAGYRERVVGLLTVPLLRTEGGGKMRNAIDQSVEGPRVWLAGVRELAGCLECAWLRAIVEDEDSCVGSGRVSGRFLAVTKVGGAA